MGCCCCAPKESDKNNDIYKCESCGAKQNRKGKCSCGGNTDKMCDCGCGKIAEDCVK